MYLLDTDIVIDYLRLYPPALAFFPRLLKKDLRIAAITQFELYQGARGKMEEKIIDRFLKKFLVAPLTEKISKTAFIFFKKERAKIALDIPDSFIAATAVIHKLILLTRNEKHYRGIRGLKIEKPYV